MLFGKSNSNDALDTFLENQSRDDSVMNRRFVARNFLLDENVAPERQLPYENAWVLGNIRNWGSWSARHKDYLDDHVFVGPSGRAFGKMYARTGRTSFATVWACII